MVITVSCASGDMVVDLLRVTFIVIDGEIIYLTDTYFIVKQRNSPF